MPFQTDRQMAGESGREFGEYLITFISKTGQVRADLFRRGRVVTAHVSFSTGLNAGSATDSYVSELWDYAREKGFPDQFKVVLFHGT